MISLRDIATAVSTQYNCWFMESFNDTVVQVEADLGRLLQTMELGDNEGDRVRADWLGGVPALREWVDEKRAREFSSYNWTVIVKDWESTVRIRLNTLKDARWNMYEPRIRGMAINAARHPYQMVSDLIRLGATTVCYDGQYMFDTDHSEGASGSQSNKLTGTGTSVAQLKTDYYAAKAALMQFKDDRGEPIWVGDFRPLVWAPATGPIMEGFETLRSEQLLAINSGSQSNKTLGNKFDVVYDPKLTDANDWYMFNPASPMKPLMRVKREEIHYVDNFGSGDHENSDVWKSRVGEAGVEGRDAYDYAMWQTAVKTTNT